MLFKKIIIRSFKGFADPTDLDIECGLNGIVGPNGCGKSNLVEAIGWTMGEGRPGAIRGTSMEDVVFSGSRTRPAHSHAEVSLHLELTALPRGIGRKRDRTVLVTRRIRRNHGSVFRMDGRIVRRKDVQLFFADATHESRFAAFVRQGQVADVVKANPRDRSRLMEEAAGIRGLQLRRHDAALKLDATERNLEQVEISVQQLKRQCAALKRQAGRAQEFRELAKRLQVAERRLAAAQWQIASASCDRARQLYQNGKRAVSEAAGAAALATRRREECASLREPLKVRLSELTASRLQTTLELRRVDEAIESTRNQLFSLTSQIVQLDRDMERERDLSRDAVSNVSKIEDRLAELSCGAAERETEIQLAKSRELETFERLEWVEKALEQTTSRHASLLSQHEFAEQTLTRAHREIAYFDRLEAEVLNSMERWQNKVNTTQKGKAAAELALKSAEDACKNADSHTQTEEEEYRRLRDAVSNAATKGRAADRRLSSVVQEIEELNRILEGAGNDDAGLLEALEVCQGYEAAVGAALGDDIFMNACGGAETSGWNSMPDYPMTQALPSILDPLTDFVNAPDILDRRLSQVGLADRATARLVQPLLLPGQRVVTPSGDSYRWDGLTVLSKDVPNSAVLRLKQYNRRKELCEDREAAEIRSKRCRRRLAEASSLLRSSEARVAQARSERSRSQAALNAARKRLSLDAVNLEHNQAQLEAQSRRLERIRSDRQVTEAELVEAQRKVLGREEVEASRKGVSAAKADVSAALESFNSAKSANQNLAQAVAERERQIAVGMRSLEAWQARRESAVIRVSELAARQQSLSKQQDDLDSLPDELERERQTLVATQASSKFKLRDVEQELAAASHALDEAWSAERQALSKHSEATIEEARRHASYESARDTVRAALAHIESEFEVSPNELLQEVGEGVAKPESRVGEFRRQVAKLRQRKSSFGPVNLLADDDLRELEAKLNGLQQERSDLLAAVDKLRRSIGKLNQDGRKQLHRAFKVINRHFAAVHKELFGGGKAWIELAESDDPLAAGFEIYCRLPGKRQTVLSLMSGGEQALTGLALIFSFFLSRPAPLCILDEVDAPLDDANASRMCTLLERITRDHSTKFLIVTHNPITMNRMDRLYGVTMQEPGVSQLVSVDLDLAKELAA
ncbi:MAG: chromosome segregation protein SMC [Rhodobacteraceae bacterium]|nr:chromosome segregation protein SMC [Paracoccaceae bacterium]